jgi:hypothetical protein
MSETNRMRLVLVGMQKRTFGPYLTANNRILISLMASNMFCRGDAKSHDPRSMVTLVRVRVQRGLRAHSRASLSHTIGSARIPADQHCL